MYILQHCRIGLHTCIARLLLCMYLQRLMYTTLFGGIEAFSTQHFRLINGFSNQFFGWGGEDDNLYDRLLDYVLSGPTRWLMMMQTHDYYLRKWSLAAWERDNVWHNQSVCTQSICKLMVWSGASIPPTAMALFLQFSRLTPPPAHTHTSSTPADNFWSFCTQFCAILCVFQWILEAGRVAVRDSDTKKVKKIQIGLVKHIAYLHF